MTTGKLLSVKDIAKRLGRHPESIRRMIRKRELPGTYEINKVFLIDENEFESWLERQKRPIK